MRLSEIWFIENYIDFELQQYRLLAYLKEINRLFRENKLYPPLSDIIFHYNNLAAFQDGKKLLEDQFPQKLDQVNLQKLELVYGKILSDDQLMQELEKITRYALEEMKHTIDNGAEIYEFVENQTCIEPVGILPLYKNEGYMLLRQGSRPEVNAYTYTVTLFEHKDARYKGVRMEYIDTWKYTVTNTYEYIKRQIVKAVRALPYPAVFRVESALSVPLEETLLPIAKRMLVKQLAALTG